MQRHAQKMIRLLHGVFDVAVISVIILLVSFAAFTARETGRIYRGSAAEQLASYRPEADDDLSFEELQKINPDVIAWLSLYGTSIDYPVVQGEDNSRYINEDIFGSFSLTGALFLDYRNAPDFSDFNNIIFGHHMEKEMMFGDLDEFRNEAYLGAHDKGDLYAGGKHFGLQVFAWMDADAYDAILYDTEAGTEEKKQMLLAHLERNAAVYHAGVADEKDRILLLSTCGTDTTNERYILAAVITDETYADPYAQEERVVERTLRSRMRSLFGRIRWWQILLVAAAVILAVCIVRRKKKADEE